jgi:hypothetical protein
VTLRAAAAAAAGSQPQVALDPVSLFAMAVIGLLLLICIGVACYCFLFKRLFEACSTGCTYCCDTCKPRCHRCCNACCWECWYPACVLARRGVARRGAARRGAALSSRRAGAGCGGRGACALGHCVCGAGWHGGDCSNASCPGTFCAHDGDAWATTCVHCASLPHLHGARGALADAAVNAAQAFRLAHARAAAAAGGWDAAVLDAEGDARQHSARKGALSVPALAASRARTRRLFDGAFNVTPPGGAAAAWAAAARASHGVCDGFGACVCAPPFLGDDCSVLGCPGGCSGRGVCAVAYPVAVCA